MSDQTIVTLDDFKDFLKITGDVDEAQLQEVLDAALENVADKVDANVLQTGERTFRVHASGRHLVLPLTHLNPDEPVTVVDPKGRELTAAELTINHLSGVVTVPRAMPGAWSVRATPREGNSSITLAVKIIAQHLWGVHRGTAGARGAAYANAGDPVASGIGYAIPRRAAELLTPYLHL